MSRSGYSNDGDEDHYNLWRGTVASAIRGRRGQAFLREMLAALDALPEKKLIAHDLEAPYGVCAIGAVGRARGVDMKKIDPEDYDAVARAFDVSSPLVREVTYENDEGPAYWVDETPERRFERMLSWVISKLHGAE